MKDFLQGVFTASFGGVNSKINPDEIERLKAAYDELQIAEQQNRQSDAVKYIRGTSSYNFSNGDIIIKRTPKTVILRHYSDGHILENLPELYNRERFEPHKKVMTIDEKDILTGHTALTIAAYEKALRRYEYERARVNDCIRDRFKRELSRAIYDATTKPDQYGIWM
jgi:hypothetical protein